ncbi:uncharacterized protein LOC129766911 [Toxorhynchites rutilus septentrionalis]|uniref:uncharacterized protein LOC129766911 n=1 Tax=Toxorhynchites rutilus septentrionalis TaxID=329112 RepID=UPI0024784E6F|nr:uncharacterized protein LOC129766911 [Toxorhynchites rutilus septentrionalis]
MSDENKITGNDTVPGNQEKYCKKCDRPDLQEGMVCCDACESWVHFNCAGVGESIAEPDKSWKCSDCLADCEGAAKSDVSFNESSVSKSSRVSQRLQLSLQLLEDQRKLKQKRADEEERIRKLEEEAKLKQLDEEQEYLKQRYALLMRIEDEKDSSSRRSGVSVKNRCERMEKWLSKEAKVGGAEQLKSSTPGEKVTLPVPNISQTNPRVTQSMTVSSKVGSSSSPTPLNQGMLYPDPTIPVPGGSVTALAKSYESLVVPTVSGIKSYLPLSSTDPVTVAITASGELFTSGKITPTVTASIVPVVPQIPNASLAGILNPPISLGTAPVYAYPAMNTMVSSATGLVPSIQCGYSGVYGNPQQYLDRSTASSMPYLSFPSVSNGAPPGYPPLISATVSSFPGIPSNPNVFPPISASYPVTRPVMMPSVLPTMPGTDVNRFNSSIVSVGPTSAQLAARQVMPRELPKFSGDPEEWPMFYSSFKNTTEVCGYTDAENLARLQRCLGGSALEAVKSRLLLPASVPYVMETLRKLYGRPETLISSLLKKVRNVPSPKSDNLNTIVTYGLVIQNLVDHIILTDQQAHLCNPMLLQELIDKLPTSLKLQWGTYKQSFGNVNLETFNNFMSGLVNLASDLSIGVDSAQNYHKQPRGDRTKPKEKLFTHANESPVVPKKVDEGKEGISKACSYCDKDGHQIANCYSYRSLDVEGRWKAMRQKNLCRLCLIPHRKWPCRSKKECGVDGCRIRHHMLLHSNRNGAADGTKSTETVHQYHHHMKSFSLFRYLPVTLYGNGKQVETFVFLDDGSSSTLLEEGIASLLGIEGEPDNLLLSWTGKISRHEKTSRRLSVNVSGAGKKEMFQLGNVRTVRELGLPSQTLDYVELCSTFPHLRGLPVASYIDARPGMIIGLEHVQLLTSLKTREGTGSEPVATKTRLGWCVYGRNSGNEGSFEQLHVHACSEMSNCDLHDSMRKFFAVEEAVVTKQLEAEEDKRARSILEATTVRRGARMETGLLWRHDDVKFPDSFPMAMSRLKGLEKRLAKDPELRRRVNEQINSYEQKQYVRKVPPEVLRNISRQRMWYLPLGVVTNPKKPNKIRMVWDAAAKAGGVSFNDMLLKGPDLLVSLVEVLLRFREGKIAVCSDIREMFLRILIREEDKWSQCFLWGDSPDAEIQVYVINVAMFGATSSPCTAQFVKNRNASDYLELYPRAVEAIIKNHYVDDFLDSVNSVEEAVQLVKQVQLVHAAAGFEFGKISSNSQEVLDLLGETGSPTNKLLNLEKDRVYERILGVVWVPAVDHFTFEQTGLDGIMGENRAVPTKRQVLRTVMKLYDPLGFVAHFVVQGKILMQEIWRTGTNWDEPIAQQLHDLWSRWIALYAAINEVKIPRCFFGNLRPQEVDEIEIHVFTDASVVACACVAYLRISSTRGNLCSLVAAKTKVSPLRTLSIPRLELQAAMMGSRLLQNVCSALTLDIRKRFLWTDSATVLAWLRSDSRRYHQFVSFRVGEILSLTSVDEWYYVPSKYNVADDATKWNSGPLFDPGSRLFEGPQFLREPKEMWPRQSVVVNGADAASEELRVVAVHQTTEEIINVERFSKWNRLVRTLAYVYLAVRIWRRTLGERDARHVLNQDDFVKAKDTLWRQAQAQGYSEEFHRLKSERGIEKGSPLQSLAPFLDERGVIRVGGRIGNAPTIPFAVKYPIVLPREAVSRSCQHCKVKKATPVPPLMGPLPKVRLTPFIRPFTYVGVDYMGPFEVKVGRSVVKRWICLFTCLTIRAIHLELAHSLSSNACVMAFRRFVARRGAPLEVFSDNGTNFVGANRQLSEEKQKIQNIVEDCAATFTNANTQWHFNVPAAPHMGGPWERMVKSVKVAMKAISGSPRHPSDEVLETIMLEAEAIINSRPLTYVPLDMEDDEALTPNHFLLCGSTGIKQPVANPVSGNILRDSWKLAQHIVDDFWRRWVREYLPMLTRRTKWFEAVKPMKPGDLVVIVDENTRNSWERGRVLETFPDKSGQVRRATVQTARGVFARPAVKLAVLDVEGNYKKSDVYDSGTEMVHGAGDVADTPRCGEKVVNRLAEPSRAKRHCRAK